MWGTVAMGDWSDHWQEFLVLWEHVPTLAGGFGLNLWISALAMSVGTVFGLILGRWRFSRRMGGAALGGFGTNLCRNVPSFVLLFYMASMIPSELDIAGRIIAVPLWIKATLALIFPVVGFVSDQSLGYLVAKRMHVAGAKETFRIAWMQYFLIIIMASATASVIGADEIVGRANTIIAAQNSDGFLLRMYLFVSMWFIAAGLLMSGLLHVVNRIGQPVP